MAASKAAPAMDADEFVLLCKELRELGALKVAAHGFEAVFPPAAPKAIASVPREVKKPEPEAPADVRAAYRESVLKAAKLHG